MAGRKPQVFVHLGHEKCGSKSIQLFLRDHRERLEELGFFSPRATKVVDYDMGLGAYAGVEKNRNEYIRRNSVTPEDAKDFVP